MAGCCDPRGCDRAFTPHFARRMAKRYRKRGLDRVARRMVAFLRDQDIDGATMLEIGGGVGEIQLELLKPGAARTVNLELSQAFEVEAERLLREAGFGDKAQRRIHDIAADPDGVDVADVVVLHRVVCCYPDHERLLSAVADHARRAVVFSYPPRTVPNRLIVGAVNVAMRLTRKEYRAFVHRPAALEDTLRRRGLRPTFEHRSVAWNVSGLER